MKFIFILFCCLALVMPAHAKGTEEPVPAANPDVFRLEPWQKRPLALEMTIGPSVRWGYEYHPAEWIQIECSIGAGVTGRILNTPSLLGPDSSVYISPMVSLAMGLTLPVPVEEPQAGENQMQGYF